MTQKREIMIIVGFWALIITLMILIPKPIEKKPEPYTPSDFPDTDGTVMYNVTIDRWDKDKKLGSMYFDEVHIKE